jgi:hypothetical protein
MLTRWSPEFVTGLADKQGNLLLPPQYSQNPDLILPDYWQAVPVRLQEAMFNGQVSYWHSPSAMWLILGGYALGGCLIALLLRGWLTRGAHWKVSHQ